MNTSQAGAQGNEPASSVPTAKRPYHPPITVHLGKVEVLTRGSGDFYPDYLGDPKTTYGKAFY